MSALHAATCPTCRADLDLRHDGDFDAWVCPNGHGLACTLSEAYERLRDEEIHAIWHAANAADPTASTRRCPMCARTMVAVPCGPVTLDVCVVDEVLWLDAGELERLPPAAADAPPSAQEQTEIAQITEDFGEALDAGWQAEEAQTITGRLSAHLLPTRRSTTPTA